MENAELVKVMEEHNESLRALLEAVRELGRSMRETREKVNDVINHSHLRSMLGLLKEDIGLVRLLDVQSRDISS